MSMPGRTYAAGGQKYKYGFNRKESSADDGFDAYDFGARSYDERLGRWMSTEPHAKTYPGQSPYQYAFNSPNLFNDPDGKDGRITIIPNSDGTGGKIIVETVVYLFGPNAKEKLSATLNEDYANLLGTVGEFADAGGKEWSIEINVTYSDKYVDELNSYFSEILDNKGDVNSAQNPVPAYVPEDLKKQLKDFKDGDNFLFISSTSTNDNSMADYMSRSNRTSSTAIHETFHLLDLIHTAGLSQSSAIYKDKLDIMEGGNSVEYRAMKNKMIHPVHYFDAIRIINRAFKGEKKIGTKNYNPKGKKNAESTSGGTNNADDVKRAESRKHKVERKNGGGSKGKSKYTNQKHYKRKPSSKKPSTSSKPTKTKK
ncbi:MAG: RHS repeat-associated core domain-containing protein [Bacteroidia bacterium]